MHLHIHPTPETGGAAAADCLAAWLRDPSTRNLMVAAGNTPLDLYRRVAERRLDLSHLSVFVLDEYVGVPPDEPRTCGNLLRRSVAEAWGIPPARFFTVSSLEADAPGSIREHEGRIAAAGGLDAVVLGLGQNGHLGFNEPGSPRDSAGRVADLEPSSIEANRRWFQGDYAPARGVTTGLRTILSARRILILAFGPHKVPAVRAMTQGPVTDRCPASFLQLHPDTHAFLDAIAAPPA
jgi:glucosamine-6-phosphate deaminase